jgi:signal transduction histidine kinase
MTLSLENAPIRQKMTSIVLLTCGAVVLLTCVAFFAYEFVNFRSTTVQQLSTLGSIIGTNSTAALAFDNPGDAEETLAALRAERHITAAALYTSSGRLFARYPADLPTTAFPVTPAADGYRFSSSELAFYQPVNLADRRLGTLYLTSDLQGIFSRIQLYLVVAALVVASACVMAFLLSRLLERHIAGPVMRLAETATAIAHQRDFSLRVPKTSEDEVGLLTDAFNQMLGKIHELNQDLEQRVVDRTARLEAVNKELEAFSYSVSHDLRAPLRHIDGFAGLLAKQAGNSLDEKSRRYVTVISESARKMGRLIDDLLTFSRMNRGELTPIDIDLNPLVSEVIRESGERRPEISWEVAELPRVQADATMLRQVWVNLIENAVKYTSRVERPRIEIGAKVDAEHGEAIFHVRDNGAGFDMKYADKLFGVFQRLHTEAEFEGTGIGLANVRRIVSRHGGRTWATGEVGVGASFYFSLPVSRLTAHPFPPSNHHEPTASRTSR